MIKHIWSVLCRESVIDQETNNISLFNVLEQINILPKDSSVPAKINIPINYEIVSFWVRDSELGKTVNVRYRVLDPSWREVFREVKNLVFPQKIRRMRSRLRFDKVVVSQGGKYVFEVAIEKGGKGKFNSVCEIPLEVVFQHRGVKDG